MFDVYFDAIDSLSQCSHLIIVFFLLNQNFVSLINQRIILPGLASSRELLSLSMYKHMQVSFSFLEALDGSLSISTPLPFYPNDIVGKAGIIIVMHFHCVKIVSLF